MDRGDMKGRKIAHDVISRFAIRDTDSLISILEV
jgi:hypothetical protein